MFAEWELIGAPLRVTVGERGLNDGVVELQARRESEAAKIPLVRTFRVPTRITPYPYRDRSEVRRIPPASPCLLRRHGCGRGGFLR
ncbi:hypothetical protein G6F68_017792 [Rhizopus microsporus]|nr:hypothetical protein G6F68_017792 [Rhizopus microsporus]